MFARITKLYFVILITGLIISTSVNAEQAVMKNYLLIGEPAPASLQAIIDNPYDLSPPFAKKLDAMGGRLIQYYFSADSTNIYIIFTLPESIDDSAFVYQRIASGLMKSIQLVEIIPTDEMVNVFKRSKEMIDEGV